MKPAEPGAAPARLASLSRRHALRGGLAAALTALVGGPPVGSAAGQGTAGPRIGFTPVPPSTADSVLVPAGYTVEVLFAWGDPISDGPPFRPDASNTAAEQEQQGGMHHDALHFFPLPRGSQESTRGLLAINHEYTDERLLHGDGSPPGSAERVAKSQAAHGVSIVEVAHVGARWQVVRPSPFARRITARTPMRLDGPAAGHPSLCTADDPAGTTVRGTLANCAHGVTPWGTYLTCEENFHGYFVNRSGSVPARQRRYGIGASSFGHGWDARDARFDAARHPNEPNRFGWVVEIDPFDPVSRPVKHTALGRFKHEGAWVTLASDRRVVVYMGDDERFEHIYKFVSRHPWDPGNRAAAMRLLEEGTLHVARFDGGGEGQWLELALGAPGIDAASGFESQAEVLVNARGAADRAGATAMDRPEWIAVHPRTGDVYASLSHNARRGAPGQPLPDAANPRADNVFGHILRWRERGGEAAATRFAWDIFALAGDPSHPDPSCRGTVKGDGFAAPDGLWFDARGVLWVQTDLPPSALGPRERAGIGNNQMLAVDPATGEFRRFLVGPPGCEVTGAVTTPDGRTMFADIQHPGEGVAAGSTWPDGVAGARPRSATVVIRKRDGGVIGT